MPDRPRYVFREETWGGLALDARRDRVWSFDAEHFDAARADPSLIAARTGDRDPFNIGGRAAFGAMPSRAGFSLSAPISISWTATLRCQSACIACCTNSHALADYGAGTRHAERTLERLAEWGVLRLIVGGGEPLLREDIDRLVAQSAACGLAPALATNGFLLDRTTARRLAPHVMQFQISLDSIRPDEYAALRGRAGGPDLALRAIRNAADTGRCVRVVTVLSARNLDRIEEIAEAVEESPADQWFIFAVLPAGRGARMAHKLALPDPAAARRRLEDIAATMRPDLAVCFWGDEAADGLAVYLTEACRLVLKDYVRNSTVEFDGSLAELPVLKQAWAALDAGAKYATLENFVSDRRSVRLEYA